MSDAGIRIVTVAREYGSGGASVAQALADRLGFRLLDQALIARIAEAASVDPGVAARLDEQVDPWLHRLGRSLWHGGFEAVAPVDEGAVVDAGRLAALTRRVLQEAAAIGRCVVVGRGAQCLFRGRPDAFHVFVYGPPEERRRRLRERLGPEADLPDALEAKDRERAAYVRLHYGEDWRDPRLYHLMINSSLGQEAVVSAILAAMGRHVPSRAQ
jgi:cytidylate kinase